MKQGKWQTFLFILGILIAFLLLNLISSIKPANEKVKELLSRHKGILIMVKSYTEKDAEFLAAIKEVRWKLRGKAGIIITDKKSGYNVGYTQSDDELPLLIIFGPDGSTLQIFRRSLDRKLFAEAVHQIETYPPVER